MKIANKIYYGGDYNPDQWDEATIEEDMRLFREAGINLVTLPVFSWAKLEPDEGVYEFAWLDQLMDKFAENGISVCLATPTTAQPAWLSTRYPEVLPVDIQGRKRTHGMRVFFCYNSLKYRERAAAIAEEMAKRYGNHPALAIWHVSNEYGTYCYCDHCQAKFRLWLKKRYKTIENLNEKWHTSFWGRIVYSFEEVTLPTELNDDYRFNPAIQLDYMRFVTDSTKECYQNEYEVLKKYTPHIPVQSNMSGYIKKLDQFVMTESMDIVGWDNYPSPKDDRSLIALKLDIMRGLKGGESFMITEQSPNQQNWQPFNKLKRPGEVRLLSYQAMAHGADTCLFFQLRQSIAGQEKFHGAVISHSGRNDTRVFKECTKLGHELERMKDQFLGGRTKSEVAIYFDWNNWWALELSSGPSVDINYLENVRNYYEAFYKNNIPVDIIPVQASLENYKVVVAPMLYMMLEGVADKIRRFVENGGTFIATTMTGLVDENDRCIFGAYPGLLKDILGIRIEETDALFTEESNEMVFCENMEGFKKQYDCHLLCDTVHTESAKSLARYGSDFYEGVTCFTVNAFGKGRAYYIGTEPGKDFFEDFVQQISKEVGLNPPYEAGTDVEVTKRHSEKGETVFVINHSKDEGTVDFGRDHVFDMISETEMTGVVSIKGRDVIVAKRI